MSRFFVFALAATLLAGCVSTADHVAAQRVTLTAPQIAVAKEVVSHDLKDPNSAQFRNIYGFQYQGQDLTMVCGEMNAKNSYGGYGGFTYFFTKLSAANEPLITRVDEYGGLETAKYVCTKS
jgi:hypothetical protein